MRSGGDDTRVVTGLWLVTALGFGVDASYAALCAGGCGIGPTDDSAPDSGTSLAATVQEPLLRTDVPEALEAQIKFLNGAGLLAVNAASEAWRHAGWEADDVAPEAKGLWLAQVDSWDWSCIELRPAFVDATEDFQRPVEAEALNRSSARLVKPFFLLESIKNNAFSFLANLFDLQGTNTSVGGFEAATLDLLDLAARALARKDLDRALVVGTGRVTQGVARHDYVAQGLALPTDDPGYRPFDVAGVGLVPGEAAATAALERRVDARAGGRAPLAALLGYGSVTGVPRDDAHAPTADTIRAAVEHALDEAEVEKGDLAAVVLPAYGLPEIDRALLEVLGDVPVLDGVPAVSWRGATGHTALADDLVSLAIAASGLAAGRMPPTVGVREPIHLAGRPIPRAPFDVSEPGVLVVGAGLWGRGTALVVSRAD